MLIADRAGLAQALPLPGSQASQSHVAIRVTKQNNTAVAGTRWIRLSAVAIKNDPDSEKPGDIVGVVQPFKPKAVEVDLTEWASATLDALGDSRHVYKFGSENWFGYAVADQLGFDGKANRKQIESLIEFMLNLAAIETYDDPGRNGRDRLCIRGVGPYVTERGTLSAVPASRRVAPGKHRAASDRLPASDHEDEPKSGVKA